MYVHIVGLYVRSPKRIFSFYVSNSHNVHSSAVKSPGERRRQRQETLVGPFWAVRDWVEGGLTEETWRDYFNSDAQSAPSARAHPPVGFWTASAAQVNQSWRQLPGTAQQCCRGGFTSGSALWTESEDRGRDSSLEVVSPSSPAQSKIRALLSQALDIPMDGLSTASLGSRSSVWPPSQWKYFSCIKSGIASATACAHHLSSFHLASLGRPWLHLLCAPPWSSCRQQEGPPSPSHEEEQTQVLEAAGQRPESDHISHPQLRHPRY